MSSKFLTFSALKIKKSTYPCDAINSRPGPVSFRGPDQATHYLRGYMIQFVNSVTIHACKHTHNYCSFAAFSVLNPIYTSSARQ